MATTEKKTTTTSKPKTTTKPKTDNNDATAKALQDALAMIEKMKGELDSLKNQSESKPTPTGSLSSRKIKCVSISHHPVNVSTQPDLNGHVFRFTRYGQVIQIKYDELLDVLASYPNTMASGLIYICDKDVVEENDLTEIYNTIYDKNRMDEIVLLRKESDADLILGMGEDLRDSTIIKVVDLYRSGERMDAGALAILREGGIDVVEMAKETKIS